MRKLIAIFRRTPQLCVVVFSLPIIVALWNMRITLPILPMQWQSTLGQWIIVLLVAYTCWDSTCGMIADLREGKLGIDLLAVVALLATLGVGEYWASWVIVLMVWTGGAIEELASMKAERHLSLLVSAAPKIAHRMKLPGINVSGDLPCQKDGKCAGHACALCEHAEFRKVCAKNETNPSDLQSPQHLAHATVCPFLQARLAEGSVGRYDTIGVDELAIGDVILVLPGESVPVDGVLLSGSAVLDTSAINGESKPRELFAGATVLSGCVNGSVVLIMRVSKLACQSQYQKIMSLVENARSTRAKAVRFADMLAVPFTVVSFALAFAAWIFSADVTRFAQVLVLATPCPLLIAVPVALLAGTGRLAKAGVVIKSQDVLEQLAKVTDVFFDKTGTLTVKQPKVVRVEVFDTSTDADRIIMLAGVLETYSQHILAGGIAEAGSSLWQRKHPQAVPGMPVLREYPVVHDVKEEAGKGICGIVDDVNVRIGRMAYVSDGRRDGNAHSLQSDEMGTYVSFNGKVVGRIVLRDVPRDNAKSTIATLRSLGVRFIAMLTGDQKEAAETIGREVGIEHVYAGLLPEDKLNYLQQHREGIEDAKRVTMMVGDGVNDAPVLSAANIGVALTDGTDTAASECAHVVIMNNNIAAVAQAVAIAKRTKRVMMQAVCLGLGLALVSMVIAAFGIIPAVVGAMMQEMIDVVAILWALSAMRSS